ncbi:hypothetical protein RY831_05060 [Noviherbaspirillum sp. CPCC 100848]|uniref:Uncharacterized protein n=1 Tax=Noviherbaspirillum album TaxID=3080276 RepID=A0ABU6J4G5_9BURK|nr:hypothetical protein [Noviherbaspirillum sp. CPCC 100848]MEC4718505.1 hypothetical protein [Noviherbaspirillum sp. CPCC 100848]
MSPIKTSIAAALLAACAGVAAMAWSAPAAWHKWRSKTDGTQICAQTPPGSGWEQADGPYKDARCTVPGKPGS